MDSHPYHHYLFFKISNDFYQLPKAAQDKQKKEFEKFLGDEKKLLIATYSTLGLKAKTTFMLWCRGRDPADVQVLLRDLFRTKLGKYLTISYTFFGIVRNSEYSGRTGKPEQVMQTYETRLPYFVLYPFTKTSEWHAMGFDDRKSIMGEHVKVGLSFPAIRQCLLYSYGLDDQEFIVSYEMKTLEEFQDLVIKMRRTAGRKYTQADTPTFTCIYRAPKDLMKWL